MAGLIRRSRLLAAGGLNSVFIIAIYCYRHRATRKMYRSADLIQQRAGICFCGRSFRLFIIATARSPHPREGQMMTTDKPVQLDEHRGMAAQKSTETRPRSLEVLADHVALLGRQEEFERHAVSAPSTTWCEVAEKATFDFRLFRCNTQGREPRRQELIARVLDDFAGLSKEFRAIGNGQYGAR